MIEDISVVLPEPCLPVTAQVIQPLIKYSINLIAKSPRLVYSFIIKYSGDGSSILNFLMNTAQYSETGGLTANTLLLSYMVLTK